MQLSRECSALGELTRRQEEGDSCDRESPLVTEDNGLVTPDLSVRSPRGTIGGNTSVSIGKRTDVYKVEN
ncbi:hypothetical protein NDU88_007644 [Pleurodeles waltl]|uniref:Uncharacterized protein n=1 Tax=Pleurodeles waltl TaxID=8319 RepID=A0AAV7U2X1_PLEWA|nr:hypothetical protein NDU88_007644 [Pleurodeles waltl]